MKFHDITTSFMMGKKQGKPVVDPVSFYDKARKRIANGDPVFVNGIPLSKADKKMGMSVIDAECDWHVRKRPYYNLWPGISDHLCSIDLSKLTMDQCHFPEPTFLIRSCCGREPIQDETMYCSAILAMIKGDEIFVYAYFPDRSGDGSKLLTLPIRHEVSRPVSETYIATPGIHPSLEAIKFFAKTIQIVAAVGVMAKNPDAVQPDVLNKDADKYQETKDAKYVERAIRNGKYGWNVGKELEASPHIRKSHFRRQWVGKGRTRQETVFVSGSVVMRRKMTEVPTGYLDECSDEDN